MTRRSMTLTLGLLVSLVALWVYGCDKLVTEVVNNTIAGHPTADFTALPRSGCAGDSGLTVLFTDHSSGQVVLWVWDFGDSTIDTTTNAQITHTYHTGGFFTVVLTVFDSLGIDDPETKDDFILVDQAKANFTVSALTGCAPHRVRFTTVNMDDITDWHWDFGDGDTSAVPNPFYTYDTAGSYVVALIASSSVCGTADTFEYPETIQVADAPVADMMISQLVGCVNDSIHFTSLSTDAGNGIKWIFGDGKTSTDSAAVHAYNNPGTYGITLIANCGQNADTLLYPDSILIDNQPNAVFQLRDTATVSTDVNWTESSTGSNLLSLWRISLNDSAYVNDSTLGLLQFDFPEVGDWEVRLIVSNACSADTAIDSINIIPATP